MTAKVLCEIKFGSKLYKTETEKSDTDYKVIVAPSLDCLLLGGRLDIKNTTTTEGKNGNEDVDKELIPVQRFIQHFRKAQAYAIEIVEAVFHGVYEGYVDDEFKNLCTKLHFMIPESLSGMVGYAMSVYYNNVEKKKTKDMLIEAKKLMSANLAIVRTVGDFVDCTDEFHILCGDNTNSCTLSCKESSGGQDFESLVLGGKKFPYDLPLNQAVLRLNDMISKYGNRTEQEVDFKALHHAIRVITQVRLLYTDGAFCYPLPNNQLLLDVKTGKLSREQCNEELERAYVMMKEAETKSCLSSIEDDTFEYIVLRVLRSMYNI